MTKDEWKIWVKKTSNHKEAITASEYIGCYYCLKVYKPSDIEEWCDRGQTAICPHCNIDGVVPFNWENHEEELETLKQAREIGFGR